MGIATTWILTEESPCADGSVQLLMTAVEGRHPRVRYVLDEDGLRAGLASGSAEAALASGEEGVTPLAGSGQSVRWDAPAPRTSPPMPTPAGLEAVGRLQRGATAVWTETLTSVDVRGLLDVEVGDDAAVVLPLLRYRTRHLVVTDDDRLLVLDEHAGQPRAVSSMPQQVQEATLALFATPATVHTSRIRVFDRDAVRCGYVDGEWDVSATSTEGRLALTLPLAFPAERFGDA